MKKTFLALCFVSTINAMHPTYDMQFLNAVITFVNSKDTSADQCLNALRGAINNNPNFKELLNHTRIQQLVIAPILAKMFNEISPGDFNRSKVEAAFPKIIQQIDSLGVRGLSMQMRTGVAKAMLLFADLPSTPSESATK